MYWNMGGQVSQHAHTMNNRTKGESQPPAKRANMSIEVQCPADGDGSSSPASPVRSLGKESKRRRPYKRSKLNCDVPASLTPSPVAIRQERLRRLEEQRPVLGADQKPLLLHSWRVIQQNIDAVGSDMFVRLFETYPDTMGAFGLFRSMTPDEMAISAELRAHGLRVIGIVGHVLDHIDNNGKLVEMLHELGRKHIIFNAKPDYIDLIGPQFLFAIEPFLKDLWTGTMEQAWSDLFRLIGHLMKEAMIL